MTNNQWFKGVFLLTIAGFVSKILSASYRVPLQNMAGDEGIYIYQQIYPFIMIAWMLSIYGYPAALSKITNEHYNGTKKIVFPMKLLVMLCSVNILFFVLLFVGSDVLASGMGDPQLAASIRYTSFLFLLIPFTAFLRGGFQSASDMRPTAISQTVEQFIRVICIVLFTYLLMDHGRSLYEVGKGAVLASIFGVAIGLIVLLIIAMKRRRDIIFSWQSVARKSASKAFFVSAMVVSLNYFLLIFFQLVDNFTMIPGLIEGGFTYHDAKLEKGVYDRGQPIVQLGIVFGSSIALALYPVSNRLKERLNREEILSMKQVFKWNIIFSVAATIGLIFILPSLNIALFQTALGNTALSVFMLMVVFISLALTLSTYLQGFGFIKRQMIVIGFVLVVKGFCNQWLIPEYGIVGAAVSSAVGGFILVIAFGWMLKKFVSVSLWKDFPFGSFLLSIASMVCALLILRLSIPIAIDDRLSHFLFAMAASVVGGIIFIVMMIVTKGFTKAEIELFPFGEKIVKRFRL